MNKKILVINAGSSTVKYQLFDAKTEKVLVKGVAERIGIDGRHVQKLNGQTNKLNLAMPSHKEAFEIVLESFIKDNVIKSLDEIVAVGHRVVQGGHYFDKSVLVDEEVMKKVADLTSLAPLHQPAHIQGVQICQKLMPKAKHVLVFDTSFHMTMPDYAYRYAIPKKDYTDYAIRRYGAHGTSHRYVSSRMEELLGRKGKFIVCHIGNGASVSAVKDGKCVDTSMGLTPLEGLVMGSRSGDLDATVVQRLMENTGMSVQETIFYLNKNSGLLGVSGVSEDMRDIEQIAYSDEKSERADDCRLALKMSSYRVKKYIGSYAAALGGVDAIAFTAGVGENGSEYREACLEGLEFMGVKLDKDKNTNFKRGTECVISADDSPVTVFVIPTDEELTILRDTKALVHVK